MSKPKPRPPTTEPNRSANNRGAPETRKDVEVAQVQDKFTSSNQRYGRFGDRQDRSAPRKYIGSPQWERMNPIDGAAYRERLILDGVVIPSLYLELQDINRRAMLARLGLPDTETLECTREVKTLAMVGGRMPGWTYGGHVKHLVALYHVTASVGLKPKAGDIIPENVVMHYVQWEGNEP